MGINMTEVGFERWVRSVVAIVMKARVVVLGWWWWWRWWWWWGRGRGRGWGWWGGGGVGGGGGGGAGGCCRHVLWKVQVGMSMVVSAHMKIHLVLALQKFRPIVLVSALAPIICFLGYFTACMNNGV